LKFTAQYVWIGHPHVSQLWLEVDPMSTSHVQQRCVSAGAGTQVSLAAYMMSCSADGTTKNQCRQVDLQTNVGRLTCRQMTRRYWHLSAHAQGGGTKEIMMLQNSRCTCTLHPQRLTIIRPTLVLRWCGASCPRTSFFNFIAMCLSR